jgi:type II secretory pathway component HofQ
MNAKDMDALRKAQSDEAERKRKAKVAEIQRKTKERQQAARVEDERQRAEEQQRLKGEVSRLYLARNRHASEADFNQLWSSLAERERLIREHRAAFENVERM